MLKWIALATLSASSAACRFDPSAALFDGLDDGGPDSAGADDGAVADSAQNTGDATTSDPDATVNLACQSFGAFSAPAIISEVSSSSLDNAPTLSADELTMIIHSSRGGGQGGRDLWIAQRASVNDAFSTPVDMAVVNSSSDEFGPSLSADGLDLYFGSNRSGGLGGYDIWTATRASTSDNFTAPVLLAGVNSTSTDYFPAISGDRLSLYLASSRSGGQGGFDTWVSTRANTASDFSTAVNLGAINSTSGDEAIAVSSDELSLFIQSTRSGGLGSNDVWVASRQSVDDSFPSPTLVNEISSSSADQATWLSPDGERLYQSSTRDGSWSIYVSERSCLD